MPIRQAEIKSKKLLEQAEKKQTQDERREAQNSLVKRLVKFAGSAAASRINYRVAGSGNPKGLLLSTPTFALCYNEDETKEVGEMLMSLEAGSSSKSRSTGAVQAFQEVFLNCRLVFMLRLPN